MRAFFEIGKPQQDAAQLLAAGELSNMQIADRLGITVQTLWNWRQREEFAALVDEHRARLADEVLRRGIADRIHRVRALNDRWNRMRQIIEARADHPDYAEAPGGITGLLAKTLKRVGTTMDAAGNERAEFLSEFALDTGLLNELRQHEKQAALELGQWVEKSGVNLSAGPNVSNVLLGEAESMIGDGSDPDEPEEASTEDSGRLPE